MELFVMEAAVKCRFDGATGVVLLWYQNLLFLVFVIVNVICDPRTLLTLLLLLL